MEGNDERTRDFQLEIVVCWTGWEDCELIKGSNVDSGTRTFDDDY